MALDPPAVQLAMRGLMMSVLRHLEIRARHQMDAELINISAVESVNWVCALDEQLRKTDQTYVGRRDGNEDGQVVPGVRYVRDRHMHQVVVSAESDGVNFFARFPPQLSAGVVWRPAADMPPGDLTGGFAEARREAYVQHLQRKPTGHALHRSGRWLTSEVQARGIDVPIWDVPLR